MGAIWQLKEKANGGPYRMAKRATTKAYNRQSIYRQRKGILYAIYRTCVSEETACPRAPDTHEYTRHYTARDTDYRFYRSRNPIPSTAPKRIPRRDSSPQTFGAVLMLGFNGRVVSDVDQRQSTKFRGPPTREMCIPRH